MEKFLSIPVTEQGNQLVSASNVISVIAESEDARSTSITYAGGKIATLMHANQVAFSMKLAIQNAIAAALQTSWKNVVYDVSVPQAVNGINVL